MFEDLFEAKQGYFLEGGIDFGRGVGLCYFVVRGV